MDNLYLKKPSENDEDNYINYVKEFKKYDYDNKVFVIPMKRNFKKWLNIVQLLNEGIEIKNINPMSLYFFMNDDELIGHISILHNIDDSIIEGHMGGAIKPTMRNQGYGKELFNLGLEECNKLNLDEIIVSCNKNNIPSNKNIISSGGVLNKVILDGNIMYKQYKVKTKRREK